ncbi:unnamed protein product, partial [Urochloa humidicola]
RRSAQSRRQRWLWSEAGRAVRARWIFDGLWRALPAAVVWSWCGGHCEHEVGWRRAASRQLEGGRLGYLMEIRSLGPADRRRPGCPAPRRRSPPDSRLQLQAPPPPRKLIPHTAPRRPTGVPPTCCPDGCRSRSGSIFLRRLEHHLAEIDRLRQEEEIDLARRRKEFGSEKIDLCSEGKTECRTPFGD